MAEPTKIPIPREHGAYVVLGACWLFGIFSSATIAPLEAALSLVATVAGFTLTEPARLLAGSLRSGRNIAQRRRWVLWIAATAAIALASGVPLLLLRPVIFWALPPALLLLIGYLLLSSRRASMTDLSIIGFVGLSLVVPVARVAATDDWTPGILVALWLFAALFFCASAWCVRVRIVGREGITLAAAAHAALLMLTVVLAARGLLPMIALVAIAPAIVRFVWVALDVARYRQQTLKRIGLVETGIALVLVVAGFWF
jgi:hypothetical protein